MHVRIKELANMFPRGCYLIDVGSDHGYLGLKLLQDNKATGVVNIDLSKSALNRSEKIYKKAKCIDKVVFIEGDGFSGLVSWPDNSVAVIAGMGTSQILRILKELPPNINHLILLSHTDYYHIRKWAVSNLFSIRNERYVEDGELVYLILDMIRVSKPEFGTTFEHIFGREEFRVGSRRKLFEKYWRRNGQRICKIPAKFRDEVEREVLSFLRNEGIV